MAEPKLKVTKSQLLKVIDELEKRPADRVRLLGDLGITVVGAGLGAAAASTAAAAAGVTSVTVLSSLASALGLTVVVATPVGWTIGVAAAGGALAYGVSRLIRSGGLSEGRKRELLQTCQDRIREMEQKERAAEVTGHDRVQFITSLREVIEKGAIPPLNAFRLIEAVEQGTIAVSDAYRLVCALLAVESEE